ncbi:Carboxypeptidase T precursor [compost metagenome]
MHAIRSLVLTLVSASVLTGCSWVDQGRSLLGGDPNAAPVAFTHSSGTAAVVLHYGDRDKLTQLIGTGIDLWSVDNEKRQAQAALTPAQVDQAKRLGMRVTQLPDKRLMNRFDAGYHTYEQITAEFKSLAQQRPDLASVIDLGDSWEKTQKRADRDIVALKVGKGTGKPVLVFAACHHPRELVTPEMVLRMAQLLIGQYGQDPEITAWVDTREIWLVPMVNPDGHALAAKGANQRKNTNDVTGGKRRVGVDLNRNYATAWGTVGDSPQPESDTFRGKAPFSEPETQAMRDLMTAKKPVFLLTIHSYSNMVLWPWDHKSDPAPDPRLAAIGKEFGKLSGYKAQQGSELYLNGGDDVDWAFETLGTLSYTIEIGSWNDGFDPPFSKVDRFWNENRPMMLYALKVADRPARVFGPALQDAVVAGSTVRVQSDVALRRVEAFLGAPGAPGTGMPLNLSGMTAQGSLSLPESRQLLWVHAQGENGEWGPWEVTWSR